LKILLDQNIPKRVKTWLLQNKADIEVLHTSEIELSTSEDSVIFEKAQELEAVLITFDEDFSDTRLFNEKNSGIIRLNVWPTTVESAIDALTRLFEQVSDNEIVGSLVIIDRKKIRIRRL